MLICKQSARTICDIPSCLWHNYLLRGAHEVSPDADDLEVLELLNNRKSRHQGRLTPRGLETDDHSAVDMDMSRPSSSAVPSHRTRNGHLHLQPEDLTMSDDDESYPIHDQDDIECSDRNMLRNNLPLIPTECGSVTEALHNFVVVFESR
ncbi:unnamed protein product [Cylicostephanus goldi]|uniref:Uncharacterized protein n=1 Tax=Cylicostephanus goldi TaxID=71465 RepID=A0A3P6QZ64_CYLGO|nr:unnamed protein product [Cylicostephanus goldi]